VRSSKIIDRFLGVCESLVFGTSTNTNNNYTQFLRSVVVHPLHRHHHNLLALLAAIVSYLLDDTALDDGDRLGGLAAVRAERLDGLHDFLA
jgi:hypothetical protein